MRGDDRNARSEAMKRRYYTGRKVEKAISIEELRRMAEKRLPAFAFEFIEGGAEDEVSLAWNRDAFTALRFLPQTLIDTSDRHTKVTLFGREQPSPLVIAPSGHNNIYRRDGDMMLARAATAAGIPMALATLSNTRLERLPKETGGRFWMQLYQFKDKALTLDVVRRADEAGYEALVLTSDSYVYGLREWDRRHFKRPGVLTLRSKLDALCHPRWLFDALVPHGVPKLENVIEFFPPEARDTRTATTFIPTLFVSDVTWESVDELRKLWPRKLLIKGILSVEDARRAANHGCDGVILSNHGARHLDSVISPMDILPDVATTVGDRLTIVIDSGFRRGSDVVKAMALGANAVMVGRAPLWGLAAGGEAGVAHALKLLQEETHRVLGQIGCPSFDKLGPQFVKRETASVGVRA
jgi:(S)-mandelate dehydrogenase